MKSKKLLLLIGLYVQLAFGQIINEIPKPKMSDIFLDTFKKLEESKKEDSSLYKGIEILENGIAIVDAEYEKYKIILNLGAVYTLTNQYEKSINLWNSAYDNGIFMPFFIDENYYPFYLNVYKNNVDFKQFLDRNNKLKAKANEIPKIDYFVNLPRDYDSTKSYPLIIVLHGRIDDIYNAYSNWSSGLITNSFISVYPNGRELLSSFAGHYGRTGISDITKVYNAVIKKYPVDTTKIVLAGQSLGGSLAIDLSYQNILCRGLILAFPVKPSNFNLNDANKIRINGTKVIIICGEQDKDFYSGQKELASFLDSAEVVNRFIHYPESGHEFPVDFAEQLDSGIEFIMEKQ